MKFKLDENLARECAEELRSAGFDALTVGEQNMSGSPDDHLVAHCQEEGRILITADLDLSDIRRYPPEHSAGHIVLRLANQAAPRQIAFIRRVIALLDQEPIAGRLWIVDEARVRIRTD